MHQTQSAFAALLAVGLLAGCTPDHPGDQQAEASPGDLFQQNCGACHGEGGRGPSLEHLRSLSEQELRAGIKNHPTAGQIQERLRADRVDKLIKYLD